MSEMVERVAKEIQKSGEGCISGLVYVDANKAARAAIEAMRDATRIVVEHMDGTVSLLDDVNMIDGSIRAERDDDVFRIASYRLSAAPTQVGAA